jgi:hypothetical protein
MSGMFLLMDSNSGIYIPKVFSWNFDMQKWHVNKSVAEKLSDVNSDDYWETWDYVLSSAYYLDDNGNKWELWQDADLWAVCYDLLTEEEKASFGFD